MDEEYFAPSVPLTWQAVGAIAMAGISGILEEIAGVFDGLATALAADHNYQIDRRRMHDQAALEIEALTKGLEP